MNVAFLPVSYSTQFSVSGDDMVLSWKDWHRTHTAANIRHPVCAKRKKVCKRHDKRVWISRTLNIISFPDWMTVEKFVGRRKKGETISWSDKMGCTLRDVTYKVFASIVPQKSHMFCLDGLTRWTCFCTYLLCFKCIFLTVLGYNAEAFLKR